MRSSSNPAFRNLPSGQGGYATFDRQGGALGGAAAYADAQAGARRSPGAPAPVSGRITIDDVVTKTAITAGIALVAGVLTALSGLYGCSCCRRSSSGFVVSLIVIFKQSSKPRPGADLLGRDGYRARRHHPGCFDTIYPGIALQAIIGTAGVFVGMLVVYKTGAVRVTPRFTKWLMGAMVGVIVLMLANLVVGLFGANTGPARRRLAGDHLQPRRDRRGGVQPAARLRPGRPGHPGRRAGEVRLVHRVRPDDHAGLALHRDPAPAELPAQD